MHVEPVVHVPSAAVSPAVVQLYVYPGVPPTALAV